MQCLEKCDSVEDKVMEAHALRGLAQLSSQLGDRNHTERLFFEAIEALQKIGDDNCIAQAYKGLGELAIEFKDFPKAAQYFGQSLFTYEKLGLKDYIVMLMERFAKLAVAMGKGERAARLMAISEEYIGDQDLLPQYLKDERNELIASIRELIGDRDLEKLFKECAATSLQDAVAYALEENKGD